VIGVAYASGRGTKSGPEASTQVQRSPAASGNAATSDSGSLAPRATAAPTSTPTVAPIPLPIVHATPPPPVAILTPLPAPTTQNVATAAGWSHDDCVALETAMQWDHDLDVQSAKDNPSYATYYNTVAAHWATILSYMQFGPCGSPVHALYDTQCSNPEAWVNDAIPTHVYDEQQHPENTAWDDQWIAIYTKIDALWSSQTPGCS
jgi:hypothetical protein